MHLDSHFKLILTKHSLSPLKLSLSVPLSIHCRGSILFIDSKDNSLPGWLTKLSTSYDLLTSQLTNLLWLLACTIANALPASATATATAVVIATPTNVDATGRRPTFKYKLSISVLSNDATIHFRFQLERISLMNVNSRLSV